MNAQEDMGLFVGANSSVIITHVLDKAALILAVIRWGHVAWSSLEESSSSLSSSSPFPSAQVITYSAMCPRQPGIKSGTCAARLGRLKAKDKVWELRNCRHVLHKLCLDGCLDHHYHQTRPLCRAPMLSQPPAWPAPTEPRWAVEHLIHLFGDDLLLF